ncbi:MAG TPA: putative metal-dependent hydrolase [Gemmatimonadales bacterium]|jgi:hypothetical protein
MSDDPRYPVGRFTPADEWNNAARTRCRDDIAHLPARLREAIEGLDDRCLDTPYRDDGWTVRQVVHHLADSHLNAYCRFRLALTEDEPTIKPYAEARWAELHDARTYPAAPSLAILDGVHARWIGLIDAMSPGDWDRSFVHPEQQRPVTLASTAALYSWHSRHHVAHINALRARNAW